MSLDNPGKIVTFSGEQQQLAHAIGQQAAIAIHNARLYQEAQMERERAERLIGRAQSIYTVAMAVNSNKDLSAVLEIATQHLICDLNACDVIFTLLEQDILSVLHPINPQPVPSTPAIAPTFSDLPYCRTVATNGVPLFITEKQVAGIEKSWYKQLGMENVMIVPLMVGDHHAHRRPSTNRRSSAVCEATADDIACVGFAFIGYPKSIRHPLPGQFAFAQDIVTQCALAIEKNQILAEAQRAAALATERANTLDAVFNAMTEGIIVLDQTGQVVMSNNTANHLLDILSSELPALTSFLQHHLIYNLRGRLIPPEEFSLTRALRGETVRGERFLIRQTDGSERAVEVNIEPLFDSEARQIGVVGAFRNVTEQVRIEQRVRRALDTMLHAAEAISGITDIKDILQRVLTMTLTTLNCDRGVVQLYDQEQQTFTPLLSTGFTAKMEQQWLAQQKIWLSPEEKQFSGFRDQLLEGHAALISAEQCPEHPNPFQHTMILAVPIKHNHHLQGIMMLDRSSRLRKESRPGITRPLANPTFNIWEMAVAEGIAQFAGLAIEQARWQQEATTARANEEMMRQSNALKDEFLAITAHEFRTPLTVILAHSQMMARTLHRTEDVEAKLRTRLNESITTLEAQTHQLTNIVNTFLEVTRLNRGQIVLNLEEINLETVVGPAVKNHAATSPIHCIRSYITSYEHPYLVMGDRARLLQIFTNLLQNAIKYSPLGGPITVSLSQFTNDEGQRMAEICVKDKGIGIPLDAQPHLFKRFYRAPNTIGSSSRGIGLGLYVVAEFLRLHGGTIHVESSGIAGEGSCFFLSLPLLEQN
jgi:signal transduction histidine kinase/PAS domain-containing protein